MKDNFMKNAKSNKKYKDTFFTSLFSDKRRLLSLYNAISGKNLSNDVEIEIITQEGVFFKNRFNDLSFVLRDKNSNTAESIVVLIEHQSTINVNMPLRFLLYVSQAYEQIINKLKNPETIYRNKLIKLPSPQFYVLYNGDKRLKETDKILMLSDAFESEEAPYMGLYVKVIDINFGSDESEDILDKCSDLKDYSFIVYLIKDYVRQGMTTQEAIVRTIKHCLDVNILHDYLINHSAEVQGMLNLEYNFELDKKAAVEDAKEEGIEIGIEEGIKRGIEKGIEKGIERGIERGIEKGIEEGIKNTIEAYKECGMPKERVMYSIKERYNLSEEKSRDKVDLYY